MARFDWLIARPIAHRGLHDAASGIVENTASAFARAVEANYGIECDLQITADGEAMVHHDDALGRLTEGSSALAAMTAEQLKQVPFKATADRILSLGELCDLVAGRVPLLLELKSHHDGAPRLPQRVAAVLSGYAGEVAAMSFDPHQVRALRAFAPGLPRGITAEHWSHYSDDKSGKTRRQLADVIAMRPQFIAYAVYDLPSAMPLLAQRLLQMPVLTWTVRSEADRARAARWADQIIFEGFRP